MKIKSDRFFAQGTLIFCFILLFINSLSAQQASDLFIKQIPIPDVYSPAQLFEQHKTADEPKTIPRGVLSKPEKQVMRKISDIYKMHIAAMQAEINNNPLKAEQHILKALTAIQDLLNNHPTVKNNKRFSELYSTVYTEYHQFYGIDKAINQTVGKIFAIRKELATTDFNWKLSGYHFPDNLDTYGLEVPLVKNSKVKRHLVFYTQKYPETMETWLKRTEKYFPMMQQIFNQIGVPTELIHLAMIESGLNPRAESWASAMGMWQFMEGTGAAYGLEVNWWVDERRDPVKATRAAARHLKDLYDRWDNWYLAIAGYNISPQGLISAIRDGGGEENYWSAWPYLPKQTQGYIPGFIAATMIERNPEKFGFKEYYDVEPFQYEIVKVAPLMPLDLLAKAAGISTQKLKAYNPELLRWATPPGSSYKLKLPPDVTNTFLANYKQIPKDARSRHIVMHVIEKGETLGYIANRYGTTVHALYEANEELTSLIHPGQKIIIPIPGAETSTFSAAASSQATQTEDGADNSAKIYYTVKSGDTISEIADMYDVSTGQIRSWNNTSSLINIGDKLAVYVPEDKAAHYKSLTGITTYQVQQNDTLIKIAQAFNVSVHTIKEVNNLAGSRIYVGQQLRISTIN